MVVMTAPDTRMTVRNLPWYGTSTALVDDVQTADDALAIAGLDWEVDTKPLYFRVRQDGKEKTVRSSKSAVYRKDTLDELGIVGGRYVPFQNREAFAFLDKMVAHGGAAFQAAGTMNGGSRVYVVMKTPESVSVLGDAHDTYVLFMTSHDGSMSVTATTTMVRLACTNMFRSALSSERPVFKAAHIAVALDPTHMTAAAEEAIGVTKRDQEKFAAMADKLAQVDVVDAEFEKIMAKAFPWTTKAAKKELAGIHELWQTSETINDEHRLTGWGLVNATTEFLSHFRSRRSDEAALKRALGVNGQIEARLVKAILA
jgi:phage/plasmid-like protein (TIGR03299 family)